jgi:hypothetical protein
MKKIIFLSLLFFSKFFSKKEIYAQDNSNEINENLKNTIDILNEADFDEKIELSKLEILMLLNHLHIVKKIPHPKSIEINTPTDPIIWDKEEFRDTIKLIRENKNIQLNHKSLQNLVLGTQGRGG